MAIRSTSLFVPSINTNYPPVAILGDSITAFNNTVNASAYYNKTVGYMTWLNILSGHQFYFPPTNNFGNPGDTLAQIAVRVPNVIAVNPAICIVLGGTNNAKNNGLTSLATMKTDMSRIIAPLLSAGIAVVVMTIPPDSRLSANEQLVRQAYNNWLIELGTGRPDLTRAAGLPTGQVPIVVDINPFLTDQTTGGWISGMTADGVHPLVPAAFYMGQALWTALQNIMPRRYSAWQDYSNDYSSTQNPTGSLLTAHTGTWAGITGTKITTGTTTITGDLATGYTITPAAPATSTTSITCSKENPRTDGPLSGVRQKLEFSTTVAGSNTDSYRIEQLSLGVGNVSAGDQLVAQVTYQLMAGSSNLSSIYILCQEVGGGSFGGYDGYALQQGNIPDVAHTGVLRSPAITLSSGVTQLRFYIFFLFNTTSGSAGAQIFLSDARLFKL